MAAFDRLRPRGAAKYKKDQSTPDGNTEFQFKAGDLDFHSSSYEWLVVTGHKATFKGEGTSNGGGSYGFMLSAIDAAQTPSTDADLFRIKIWNKNDSGTVVYDNLTDASDNADPTTILGGGNIVIHDGKGGKANAAAQTDADQAGSTTKPDQDVSKVSEPTTGTNHQQFLPLIHHR